MTGKPEIKTEEISLPGGKKSVGVKLDNGSVLVLSDTHLKEKTPVLDEYELLTIAALNTEKGFQTILEAMRKRMSFDLLIRDKKAGDGLDWYAWGSVVATDTETFVHLHYMQV